jgi:multiple sugar transport system permease protein
MKNNKVSDKIRYVILFVFGLLMLFPFVWMLSTSIKQGREVYSLSLLVKSPSIANYTRLF